MSLPMSRFKKLFSESKYLLEISIMNLMHYTILLNNKYTYQSHRSVAETIEESKGVFPPIADIEFVRSHI